MIILEPDFLMNNVKHSNFYMRLDSFPKANTNYFIDS